MNMAKTDSCMVCGYDLEYLDKSISSSCVYCTKVDEAYFICKRGHYVCEECHPGDIIEILTNFCLSSASENPLEMANILMGHEKMHMIGPEHHPMIAAVLVTAYKNKTTKATDEDIKEAIKRGSRLPAGYCGLYGADAAAISTGIAMSIITGATPLTDVEKTIANMLTSRVLAAISNEGGKRCCKRSTWIALKVAVRYIKEVLDVDLESIPASEMKCGYFGRNKHCNKENCRFF